MSKIKFKTMLNGNDLAFTIVGMDERARGNSYYEASNGLTISSDDKPELHRNCVYLRGRSSEYDKSIVLVSFSDHKEALKYKNRLVAALKEWTEKARCFNETTHYDTTDGVCEEHEF